MKKLSVIVCTHNHQGRFPRLRRAILSLSEKENSDLILEVIVIDNGSSISKSEKNELLKLNSRIIFIPENKIGLSVARNTGIKNSNGDILAFIDDDVRVADVWAKNIVDSYNNDEVLCAGGEVKMTNINVAKKKNWVSNYFLRFISPIEFPEKTGRINEPFFLIGANMSFKKNVFEKYGLFNEELGRVGSKLLSNEDTEFISRLPKGNIFFIKSAEVFGEIDENRLTRRYMLLRLFWQGYSDYIFIRKVGVINFFDKHEILFDRNFIIFWSSKLLRLKLFEIMCGISRIIGFHISKNKTKDR